MPFASSVVLLARSPAITAFAPFLGLLTTVTGALAYAESVKPVTIQNFPRAESHMYFAKAVKDGAFGKLVHQRAPVAIEKQDVIRMNRDTLYSSGVFDLNAGPVTIILPDTDGRFMSLLIIDEDHYTQPVTYAPGRYTFTRDLIGTRYMFAAVRRLADPTDAADLRAATAAQDRIEVQASATGRFEIPN